MFEAGRIGEPSALIGSQDIQVGNGFSSAGLPLAHFGLGSRAAVDVVLTIPFGGGTVTRTGVTADQLVTLSPPLVVTAPTAPLNPTATAGNASATITWVVPASDGGSPITGYTVTSNVGGFSATVDGSTLSTVIAGLTNGTSYRFRVVATNAIGHSALSAQSNAVKPMTVPGAPTNVAATAGSAGATVSWTPPAFNGGSAITGYTLAAAPGGRTKSVVPA